MHAPSPPVLTPFLQKFHGKQQKIDRDGILRILHQNKPQQKETSNAEGQNKVKAPEGGEVFSMDKKVSAMLKVETPQKPALKL